MAISNDNLWILKDGTLGLEIHSCDKNKELRTGDSNDSCILKSNWIKRDITECGDDVTGLCGRYIQKDSLRRYFSRRRYYKNKSEWNKV